MKPIERIAAAFESIAANVQEHADRAKAKKLAQQGDVARQTKASCGCVITWTSGAGRLVCPFHGETDAGPVKTVIVSATGHYIDMRGVRVKW